MWLNDNWLQLRLGCLAGCVATWAATGGAAAAGWNAELLSRISPQRTRAYNDCWGYSAPNGVEIAILGLSQGVSFVDVTDPRQPSEAAFFASTPTTHRDFRTYQEFVYEVNETDGGLRIYDLSDPRYPVFVRGWDETFTSAHNIGIYDGFAYIVGSKKDGNASGTRILDLSDPIHPVDVGSYSDHYVHDIFVRNDVAYMSTIQRGGFTVVNVSDKSQPRQVAFRPYSGANTHNSWLSDDGKHLLTTDETAGGHLRIWATRDLSAVAQWSAHPTASIHNVVVKGDSAYISYYTEGLHVVDISNPTFPVPVASYDTWPGPSGGFNGAWGVYPFAKSGNIYVSDIATGLYVVRVVDGGVVASFELLAPPSQLGHAGQTLLFPFDLINHSLLDASYDITATNDHGWAMDYPEHLNLAANASAVISVFVSVPMDVPAVAEVDVELCVTSTDTDRSLCESTEVPTPVLLQAFEARQSGGRVALAWELEPGAAESGEIVILRAPRERPASRIEHARLPLRSGQWLDRHVRVGETYVYTLGLETQSGLSLLAERTLHVGAPARSRLLGNSPNPFNPATHIEFELSQPGDVSLRVYDSRGRVVRTLLRPALVAGRHEVLWNGLDQAGNPQASGVYFYEVRSPQWSARGRMVLLR
jgi:choice-of-anchor B domain-containing protein